MDPSSTATPEEQLSVRLGQARAYKREERFAESLKAYMDVFEDSRDSAEFAGVRLSYVLGETAELGEKYQPAKDKLVALRDEKEELMLADDVTKTDIHEWTALNDIVDPQRTVSFYGALVSKGERDSSVAREIRRLRWQQLISAKRYSDLLESELATLLNDVEHLLELHQEDGELRAQFDDETWKTLSQYLQTQTINDCNLLFECAIARDFSALADKVSDVLIKHLLTDRVFASLIETCIALKANDRARQILVRAEVALPVEQRPEVAALKNRVDSLP